MNTTISSTSQQLPAQKNIDFQTLLPASKRQQLSQQLADLQNYDQHANQVIQQFQSSWQQLSLVTYHTNTTDYTSHQSSAHPTQSSQPTHLNQKQQEQYEQQRVDWLIDLFNTLFAYQHVTLVRGQSEPEYFPAQDNSPARIEFAHGFFASALHELSHWCIAGKRRRQLPDFGYWYTSDGRTQAQQQAFEKVEIKPQAIECLFTLACGRNFYVSQDNLFADFDTSKSTFAQDVYQQVEDYLAQPQSLPTDAQYLLGVLLQTCQNLSS